MDSAGLLQDTMPSPPTETVTAAARFRPYAHAAHTVTKGRYITSNDPRGYIPVYEYPLNNQWIMMDIDDGYILWTGIWKALGNAKADIVRMLESQPDLAPQLRRVRGGYLKIQGTWMPYEIALRLARRVAWPIREDLIPLFGPTFPSTCLSPDQPGYGQVVTNASGRRRVRRNVLAGSAALEKSAGSSRVSGASKQHQRAPPAHLGLALATDGPSKQVIAPLSPASTLSPGHPHSQQTPTFKADPGTPYGEHSRRPPPTPLTIQTHSRSEYDYQGGVPASFPPTTQSISHAAGPPPGSAPVGPSKGLVHDFLAQNSPIRERAVMRSRYTPYGPAPRAPPGRSPLFDLPFLSESRRRYSPPLETWRQRPNTTSSATSTPILLPPLQNPSSGSSSRHASSSNFTLPPISSMYESGDTASPSDPAAVLRRLTLDDESLGLARQRRSPMETEPVVPTLEQLWTRRRSLSAPPFNQEVGHSWSSGLYQESSFYRHQMGLPSQRQGAMDHSQLSGFPRSLRDRSYFTQSREGASSCEPLVIPSPPPFHWSRGARAGEIDGLSSFSSQLVAPGHSHDGRETPRLSQSSVPSSSHSQEQSSSSSTWPLPQTMSGSQRTELDAYRFGAAQPETLSPSCRYSGVNQEPESLHNPPALFLDKT